MGKISSLMMGLHYSGKYMTIKKIALIGAGQLGSRHLQGLAKAETKLAIEVVEPSSTARTAASERFSEIPCHHDIELYKNIGQLSDELDLVIIATNSDVRARVVRELLSKKKVNNLVLEKVLFQKVEDYLDISERLIQNNVNAWVNHARRSLPFYHKIKCMFKKGDTINLSVTGGGWGLACNGLHFIDLISFLVENEELSVFGDLLDPEIIEAKRTGFKEVTGVLTGNLGPHKFSIHCQEALSPVIITLFSSEVHFKINESMGVYEIATRKGGWKWETHQEKIVVFQSDLTTAVARELLNNGSCELPSYQSAQNLHIPFIKMIQHHINTSGSALLLDHCPIT